MAYNMIMGILSASHIEIALIIINYPLRLKILIIVYNRVAFDQKKQYLRVTDVVFF